jgi:hypothetical protein
MKKTMANWSANRLQRVTKQEMADIRSLCDFDLILFITEIHEHGWHEGRKMLPAMIAAAEKRRRADASWA